jgi:regulator of RNase E activity RraA
MNELRIHPAAPALDADLLERYSRVPVSALSDSLERRAGAVGLSPVGDCLSALDGRSMAGCAFTVRTRPGDNLAVHKALDLARPGDVIVVDGRGEVVNALVGDLMSRYAASRGITGLVIDGAVRDRACLSRGSLPVYARGISHLGPYKSGPGELHGAVSVGGVTVHDGDVIVGDEDGVAVVPRARALEAVEAAEAVVDREAGQRRDIDAGTWDRTWLDDMARLVHLQTTR